MIPIKIKNISSKKDYMNIEINQAFSYSLKPISFTEVQSRQKGEYELITQDDNDKKIKL